MRSRNLGCWCGKYIAAVPNAKTIHLSHEKSGSSTPTYSLHKKNDAFFDFNDQGTWWYQDPIPLKVLPFFDPWRPKIRRSIARVWIELQAAWPGAASQNSTCTLPENKDTQNDALEKESSASNMAILSIYYV